jgi:cold shock CspA family protein
MRAHGTLKKWNDDRGYGFIALPQSHEEIFVHISAFQRSGTRPCIGETISFEVRTGPDGRKRAENVLRPGASAPVRERRHAATGGKRGALGTVLAIAAIGTFGVSRYLASTSGPSEPVESDPIEFAAPQQRSTPEQRFKCDGRTHCSQMTSCAEAMYFLKNCPNPQLDGNNDGEPCEQQWCN